MQHELVTIATFNLPTQVALLRSRLESEGIECFLDNELTIQTDPLLSPALGGVRLNVMEKDVEQARLILEDFGIDILEGHEPLPEDIIQEKVVYWLQKPFLKKLLAAFVIVVLIGLVILKIFGA